MAISAGRGPGARVTWEKDYNNDDRTVRAGLVSMPGTFALPVFKMDSSYALFNVGLSGELGHSNVTGFIAVNATAGQRRRQLPGDHRRHPRAALATHAARAYPVAPRGLRLRALASTRSKIGRGRMRKHAPGPSHLPWQHIEAPAGSDRAHDQRRRAVRRRSETACDTGSPRSSGSPRSPGQMVITLTPLPTSSTRKLSR